MIKLGNNVFEVPVPSAMKSFGFQQTALPVAGRIVGVFFHVLGVAPDSDPEKLMGMDVAKVLPQALPYIGEIFSAMPPGELEKITKTLLGNSTADRVLLFDEKNPAGYHFDGLMAGRTEDTWRLLWHALGIWYPDFFARGRALFATAAKESRSEG